MNREDDIPNDVTDARSIPMHPPTMNKFTKTIQSFHDNMALILYSLSTVLLFADQNLLSPNLSTIAKEFGFTDIERDIKLGGDISIAFFLLGAPASYIVGCLGDIYPRTPLFVLMILFGEGGKSHNV